jgi:UDP-N-acetylglucosamine 2-epimerase (non-hydrolysing)
MLNFNGVLIRTSTERPEVLDKGTIVVGGITTETIMQALDLSISMANNNEELFVAGDYTDTNVSVKVVKIIQSYTDIVNRTTWLK